MIPSRFQHFSRVRFLITRLYLQKPHMYKSKSMCKSRSTSSTLPDNTSDCPHSDRHMRSWHDFSVPYYFSLLCQGFFLVNSRFFARYLTQNEPRSWTSLSIWYENRRILGMRKRTSLHPLYMARV